MENDTSVPASPSSGPVNSFAALRFRIIVLELFLIAVGLYLGWRFFYQQILQHDYYLAAARKLYTAREKQKGSRGEIFDRDGNLLVGNSPNWVLECTPHNLKNEEARLRTARILGAIFPEHKWQHYYGHLAPYRMTKPGKAGELPRKVKNLYYKVTDKVSLAQLKALQAAIKPLGRKDKRQDLRQGIFAFTPLPIRSYPKKRLLSNVLGYMDMETPRSGLETRLDGDMKPGQVVNVYERTRNGLPLDYCKPFTEARDGRNIHLTISEPIQSILEEELDAAYAKWTPKTLLAAIADPKTGEILAIAQRPTFDPEDRNTYKNSEGVRMRVVQDIFEPGSIAKPFTVLKALEEGAVTPDSIIDCEKGHWIFHKRALTDSHSYDKLTVSQVIQKSSNIGTAKIALMLGKEKVNQALRRFGIGSSTGLPFGGESSGRLMKTSRWGEVELTRISIGYTFQTTVPQLLRAYCGLANNGHVPQLKLIKGYSDPKSKVYTPAPEKPAMESGASPEALYKLIQMMVSVTEKGGTATQAAIKGYRVAGKTGTSRKTEAVIVGKNKAGKDIWKSRYVKKYYASFAGFVPAESPRLVMVVTTDEPHGASYGGTVSGPVFRKTMERTLRYLNIPPSDESASER